MQELCIAKIHELILETQENKNPHKMYIHKSPCADNNVGAVFFAICGTPPKGYALYLPNEEGKAGTLHIFDSLGLKRKIIHCNIRDLGDCKENDVWYPQTAAIKNRAI